MQPLTSAPHSPPPADDLLDTDADAAGENVPMAASQPRAGSGGKKPPVAFGRVWSEADEVRILEGLAAYAASHGAEPSRSQLCAALHGRVLDKAGFTVTQIYEKVRRLRINYANMRSAGGVAAGAVGGDEVRKYELSMAIWGDRPLSGGSKATGTKAKAKANASASASANANANANANGNMVSVPHVRRGLEELQDLYPSLALAVERNTDDESLRPVLKRSFQLISDEQARELDAKVKKHMAKEVQVTLNLSALRKEVLNTLIRSMD